MDQFEWHDSAHIWFDMTDGFKTPHVAFTSALQSTFWHRLRASLAHLPSGAGNGFERITLSESSSRAESNDCSLSLMNMARKLELTAFPLQLCLHSSYLTLLPLPFPNSQYLPPSCLEAMFQNKTKHLLSCFSSRKCHILKSLDLIRWCTLSFLPSALPRRESEYTMSSIIEICFIHCQSTKSVLYYDFGGIKTWG